MDLPILAHKEAILALVRANPVVIITGEPGTGKTTQIPQYLLDCRDLPRTLGCRSVKIVVTQPRRVAAVAMARRVAYERKARLGHEVSPRQVGYAIRFEDRSSQRTQIKYVTDGVLIRECLQDPDLTGYTIVMLDEVHERTLDTDVLLALAKQAVHRRAENMRLIVTSATLNIDQFANYFDNCPVLQIATRAFNVEVLHCTSKADRRVENSVTAAIRIHLHEGPGDVLVFLTGSEECERACRLCLEKLNQLLDRGKPVPSMVIMPLYGAMPSEEQAKVFEPVPRDCRKVIFSTNIAETSLTIQGICFVIDCGYVKQKIYNPKTGLDALLVVPISRQQARQRAGRAGRTADGKCYRLYSDTFAEQQMEEAAKPEILRVNLSSTLLTLKAMGIHDVSGFEFMDPPDYESSALKLLYYLGAIYEDGRITPLGKEMSRLPVEPCFARCLVASVPLDCSSDMLTVTCTQLVAILSTESLWQLVPKSDPELSTQAIEARRQFLKKESDHVTYTSVYKSWLDSRGSEAWCFDHFVNARALRQSSEVRSQLREELDRLRLPKLPEARLAAENNASARLRMALCMGFYMNSARAVAYGQPGSYLAVRDGTLLHLDKDCAMSLLEYYPSWILYTQLGGASLLHGSMKEVSKIKSEWIEDLVPRLKQADEEMLTGGKKRPRTPPLPAEPVVADPAVKLASARDRYLQRKGGA